MDRKLEKRLSERVVAIGRDGEVSAFQELLDLVDSTSANVRRLAASALGKLAWSGVDQNAAVSKLAILARSDPHTQTRQYAIKALKAYGAASLGCLNDLKDMGHNPSEKDYIRRDANSAWQFIEETVKIAELRSEHRCQRCNSIVDAAEYARSEQVFQRWMFTSNIGAWIRRNTK